MGRSGGEEQMSIHENLSTFFGKTVRDFEIGDDYAAVAGQAPRLRLDWDQHEEGVTFFDLFSSFIAQPRVEETEALVIGMFGGFEGQGDSTQVVELLVANRTKLPKLRALFIGDIISEENEISWIQQSDMAPIWGSFPELRHFQVRGAERLSLGRIIHPKLETLIVEAGGLPLQVVREALGADTPELRHLELWLGSDNYGATSSVADLAALFAGKLFPNLRHLGLRDCEYADELARALAAAPLLGRLESVDLSLGTLGDDGGKVLAATPAVRGLKRLDLHRHYMSDGVMQSLRTLGIDVDLDDQEKDHRDERYVAVSE
jgi:hypothetical protein